MDTDPQVPPVLVRAFEVLQAIGQAGPIGADIHEIHGQTGQHVRTIYRHISSLKALGMIAAAPEPNRYRLGPAIAGLAQNASDQHEFLRRAQMVCVEIAERTQEPVHVTVADQGTAVTVASATRDAALAAKSPPIVFGSRRPLHASASGKIFLAFNPSAFEAYSLRPLQSFTSETITDIGLLEKECLRIRDRGYSQDRQEYLPGVTCVAVPVFGVTGRAVGALTISGNRPVLTASRRNQLLKVLLPAAREFTASIGGVAPGRDGSQVSRERRPST